MGMTVLAAITAMVTSVQGHAPYLPAVSFTNDSQDYPLPQFAAGRLGIIYSFWNAQNLVVAYRYLSGMPMTVVERRAYLDQIHKQDRYAYGRLNWEKEWLASPVRKWVRARALYRKDRPPDRTAYEDWWKYTEGENCLAGAFENAVQTLRARARRFGGESTALQEWINGQDTVFLNCPWDRNPARLPEIPASLPPTAPSLLQADRAYQIAAAHFYSGDYRSALAEFEAIAADKSSPWSEWGSYLAARAVLRSSLSSDRLETARAEQFDRVLMMDAERRFTRLAGETENPAIRSSANGLLSFIAFHLRPEEQFQIVVSRLQTPQPNDTFGRDARDLSTVLSTTEAPPNGFPGISCCSEEYYVAKAAWKEKRFAELRPELASNELADWIVTMSDFAPAAQRVYAVERWRATRSLPWLVAAISKVQATDPVAPDLLAAAAAVTPESPANLTLIYHRARLLNRLANFKQVRELLDPILAHSQPLPVPLVNALKAQRLPAAADLSDFVRLVWRQPISFSNGSMTAGEADYCGQHWWGVRCDVNIFQEPGSRIFLPQLDFDAVTMLNQRIPLALLGAIVRSAELPPNIRNRMAPAVWTRAAVLDRPQVAASVALAAIAARPDMKPFIESYQAATNSEERTFRAAYAIAHFPGLRPVVEESPRVTRFDYADSYRDNWWCEQRANLENHWEVEYYERQGAVPFPGFLNPEEREAAQSEAKAFASLGGSSPWLTRILIEWAKAHPTRPEAPEALHFAWRVMKFACGGDTKRSREVFQLLHKRYPDSPWTQKTRFWY